MASLAELRAMPKEELLAKYERVKNGMKHARVHAKRVTENLVDTALAGVGGFGSAVIQFKHPKVMATPASGGNPAKPGYDTDAVVAAGIVLAVAADLAGGYDRQLLAIGQGLTGAVVAREGLDFLQKRAAAQKKAGG
jgi:hypothetical protein